MNLAKEKECVICLPHWVLILLGKWNFENKLVDPPSYVPIYPNHKLNKFMYVCGSIGINVSVFVCVRVLVTKIWLVDFSEQGVI